MLKCSACCGSFTHQLANMFLVGGLAWCEAKEFLHEWSGAVVASNGAVAVALYPSFLFLQKSLMTYRSGGGN